MIFEGPPPREWDWDSGPPVSTGDPVPSGPGGSDVGDVVTIEGLPVPPAASNVPAWLPFALAGVALFFLMRRQNV